jgi:hypothetical protein
MLLTAERLRKYLEERPDMSATMAEATVDLGVSIEQIHAAAAGDYWIMTDVYIDTNEPYVALEGE